MKPTPKYWGYRPASGTNRDKAFSLLRDFPEEWHAEAVAASLHISTTAAQGALAGVKDDYGAVTQTGHYRYTWNPAYPVDPPYITERRFDDQETPTESEPELPPAVNELALDYTIKQPTIANGSLFEASTISKANPETWTGVLTDDQGNLWYAVLVWPSTWNRHMEEARNG